MIRLWGSPSEGEMRRTRDKLLTRQQVVEVEGRDGGYVHGWTK